MTLDQLRQLCEEAARELVARTGPGQAVPAAVVLPLPSQTHLTTLEQFPDDDSDRHLLLSHFAADRMVPASAPCFGFVAEADLTGDGEDGTVDVVLVAYGARQRGTWITAAVREADGLGAFGAPEQLDPSALPFLRPLQHAADMATVPDQSGDDVLGLAGWSAPEGKQ